MIVHVGPLTHCDVDLQPHEYATLVAGHERPHKTGGAAALHGQIPRLGWAGQRRESLGSMIFRNVKLMNAHLLSYTQYGPPRYNCFIKCSIHTAHFLFVPQ